MLTNGIVGTMAKNHTGPRAQSSEAHESGDLDSDKGRIAGSGIPDPVRLYDLGRIKKLLRFCNNYKVWGK